MNTPETGRAIYGPPNPVAPVTVVADYTNSSVALPETGLADYTIPAPAPYTGLAVYLFSQEYLGIAVPYGYADYTASSSVSPETGRAIYS